ncbi:MAG: flavin reductase family protein [Coriobacteriia bacterium]|nr:flavin reductase family protein [Coriobacteriia bacterium]
MKKRLGPRELLYPMPAVFVVSAADGEVDVMAVAWIAIAGAKPPSVMMSVRSTRKTLELIERSGEFTVNTPSASMAAQLDFTGIVSGRTVTDKIGEAGLTAIPASVVGVPIIAECPHNLECRVARMLEHGDHTIVIGEIVETHVDESVLDETGGKPLADRIDPLVYIPTVREYRRLGEKVADAYSVGRRYLDGPAF